MLLAYCSAREITGVHVLSMTAVPTDLVAAGSAAATLLYFVTQWNWKGTLRRLKT